jgi:UDP-glucose 4-epimerase
MKKVLITGVTGYVGSHLAQALVHSGQEVHGTVRSVVDASLFPQLHLHRLDLQHQNEVSNLIHQLKPEIVFHLASAGCYSYTDSTYINTLDIIRTNFFGTQYLVEALQKEGCCKLFVHTGSCFEYGDSPLPCKESDQLLPINVYGVSKAAASFFVQREIGSTSFPAVIIRPFTVFGPDQKDTRFISTVIRNLRAGQDISLPNVRITRDYVYINDLIDCYLKLLHDYHLLLGQTLNICTGKAVELEQIVKIVQEHFSSSITKVHRGKFALREGEVLSIVGDPQKTATVLGWRASWTLESGLKNLLQSLPSQE